MIAASLVIAPGLKVGSLTVVARAGTRRTGAAWNEPRWIVRCSCGRTSERGQGSLARCAREGRGTCRNCHYDRLHADTVLRFQRAHLKKRYAAEGVLYDVEELEGMVQDVRDEVEREHGPIFDVPPGADELRRGQRGQVVLAPAAFSWQSYAARRTP